MASQTTKLAGKCPFARSPEQLKFAIPEHQVIFERLSKLKFGLSRFPDVNALREIQLGDEMTQEVEELLSIGSWWHLLSIKEPSIRMLNWRCLDLLSSTDRTPVSLEMTLSNSMLSVSCRWTTHMGRLHNVYTGCCVVMVSTS